MPVEDWKNQRKRAADKSRLLAVRMPAKLAETVKRTAADNNTTQAAIFRQALTEFLARVRGRSSRPKPPSEPGEAPASSLFD